MLGHGRSARLHKTEVLQLDIRYGQFYRLPVIRSVTIHHGKGVRRPASTYSFDQHIKAVGKNYVPCGPIRCFPCVNLRLQASFIRLPPRLVHHKFNLGLVYIRLNWTTSFRAHTKITEFVPVAFGGKENCLPIFFRTRPIPFLLRCFPHDSHRLLGICMACRFRYHKYRFCPSPCTTAFTSLGGRTQLDIQT